MWLNFDGIFLITDIWKEFESQDAIIYAVLILIYSNFSKCYYRKNGCSLKYL